MTPGVDLFHGGFLTMKQVSNIQVLRGLAALGVMVFHAQDELRTNHLGDPFPDLTGGAFGVDLFFAISGFIMVYSSTALFGAIGSAALFMAKRIARIAPLYWLFTALCAIVILHQTRHQSNHSAFFANLAASLGFVSYLANEDGFPVYSLGWTLEYEMFFYVCFSAALALPRHFAVFALAAALAILTLAGQIFEMPYWASYLASSQILEFAAGMLAAELYLAGVRLRAPFALALIGAGVVGLVLTTPTMDDWWAQRGLVWGSLAAAILAGAALWPAGGAGRVRGWFEAIGDASYSLYLVHYALFLAIATVLRRIVDLHRIPPVVYFVFLVCSAIAAALASYRFFEAPVTRALQRRLARLFRPRSVAPLRST